MLLFEVTGQWRLLGWSCVINDQLLSLSLSLPPSKCWKKFSCLSKCSKSSQIEVVDPVKAKVPDIFETWVCVSRSRSQGFLISFSLTATTFFTISTHSFYSLGHFVLFSSAFMKYETHHQVWNKFPLVFHSILLLFFLRVFVTFENWQYTSAVVCNSVWPLFAKHPSFSGRPLSIELL